MKHWRSLDEYSKTVESAKESSEFAEGVTDNFDPSQMNGLSRRKFLALLTASAAFTAAACSDYQDKGEIIPYTDRPERLLPGKPNFYASSVRGYPVLVRTREGRPINIEGNPDHPIQKGKIDAKTTSSILNLYDPERLKNPTKNKRKIEWRDADSEIFSALNAANKEGKEISFISHKITSSAELKLISELKAKFPSLKHYSYDLFNKSSRKNAWEKCFGNTAIPSVKWNKADVIVSLES
ncbi:MAG: TAT-variant-translocated molybdopterin oxidoreductase, partial [Bacteroidetes bacterium]|nr:TAT-variant-translocated molybdopterin oxidoreductase [Bacteroidota bacterium]